MTQKSLLALLRRAKKGNVAARNAVILANLGLIQSMARRLARAFPNEQQGDLFNELVSAAVAAPNSGIVRAIAMFDPDRGVKFSSYAGHWIKDAMTAALPRYGIGRCAGIRHATIRRRHDRMLRRLGREPTVEEIQATFPAARKPGAAQIELALHPGGTVSYDAPPGDLPGCEQGSCQPQWQSDGFSEDAMIEALDRRRRIAEVREALTELPKAEARAALEAPPAKGPTAEALREALG